MKEKAKGPVITFYLRLFQKEELLRILKVKENLYFSSTRCGLISTILGGNTYYRRV
jgi:hypothetical protein